MITPQLLAQFEERYLAYTPNRLIEHAIAKVGINDASLRQEILRKHNFVFSHEVPSATVTNQQQSGRCWIFAGLNVFRLPVMKKLNLENFEFSQAYIQFYDKLEKANTFLTNITETKDLPLDDRLVQYLLKETIDDGGFWDFLDGLVEKYGLVPKECMPETFHSANTAVLNSQLTLRLRRAAMDIRRAKSAAEISVLQEQVLYEVYNICVKALGHPPKTVEWSYVDKDKHVHKLSGLTPLEFMHQYTEVNLDELINLVADPRPENELGRLYELPYCFSVAKVAPVRYLNVPLEELKRAAIASIKDGIPVWLSCDVGKCSDRKSGIMDTRLYAYDETLTPLGEFSKADLLATRTSEPTHAMAFTGVDLDEQGQVIKWKVENSWGEDNGHKGIFSMSDDWFDAFNYSIIVNKCYVDAQYLAGLDKPVIHLPFYDNSLG